VKSRLIWFVGAVVVFVAVALVVAVT